MVKSQTSIAFTKSNTPPWVFFTFFKLRKWYEIAQNVSYVNNVCFNEDLTIASEVSNTSNYASVEDT